MKVRDWYFKDFTEIVWNDHEFILQNLDRIEPHYFQVYPINSKTKVDLLRRTTTINPETEFYARIEFKLRKPTALEFSLQRYFSGSYFG